MKLFNIGLIILCTMSSCAQTNMAQGYIKGKQFEGYIFPKDYIPVIVHFEGAKERYTPTREDITKVEQIVKDQLANINQPLVNQGGSCPIIHNNLSKYKRQYVGYIDEKGDKIVWVNYIIGKDKAQISSLNKDVIMVLDGCGNYWNIKVNISKAKLYDLQINGSA